MIDDQQSDVETIKKIRKNLEKMGRGEIKKKKNRTAWHDTIKILRSGE